MARASPIDDVIHVHFDKLLSDIPSVYYGVICDGDQKKEVAVKKIMYKESEKESTENELKCIIGLEPHLNAIRYLRYKFSSQRDLFIAMELCRNFSLNDILESSTKSRLSNENLRKILVHIALGLWYVHKNRMTFVTLKPKCILLAKNGESIKITGFGLRKWAEKSSTSKLRSIEEWGSPEHYLRQKKTNKSDVFSVGLIFHYVASDGKHPFGEESTKENIQKGNQKIDVSRHPYPLIAEDLIRKMISPEPKDRLSADQILLHPLLWNENKKEKCANFLLQLWKLLPCRVKKGRADLKSVIESQNHQKKRDAILLLYCNLVSEVPTNAESKGYFVEAATRNKCNLKQVLQSFNQPVEYSKLDASEFAKDEKHDIPDLSQLTIAGVETSLVPTNVHVAYDYLDINPQPLREGSYVFVAKVKNSPAKEMKIVKLVSGTFDIKEIFQKFNSLEDPGIIKVEVQDHQWPANEPALPFSGKKCLRIIMKDCLQKTLIELAQCEKFSPDDRKIASVQILYALHELHGSGIIHGNISPEKFCMSKEGTTVKMLASRQMVRSSNEDLLVADLRSTAKVLCALMCCEGHTSITDIWKKLNDIGDMHRFCESSLCSDGAVFYDLLDRLWKGKSAEDSLFHSFFWSADERLNFWCKLSNDCNLLKSTLKEERDKKLKELAPENWIELLKLYEDEKAAWFAKDPDGFIYRKANAENSEYRKNSSKKSQLLRLIRNVSSHIVEDIDKYKLRHGLNPSAKQRLFQNSADIWKFFNRRFGGLFYGTYTLVREETEVRDRLKKNFPAKVTNKTFPRKKRTDFEIKLSKYFADQAL